MYGCESWTIKKAEGQTIDAFELWCWRRLLRNEEELKSLLMKVKVESKKVGLKLNIQKMKIMAFGPIISWEIDGETWETCMQVRKQQLELDMEQQTGSK